MPGISGRAIPTITQGANTTEAQYVAKQLARETGRRQFITKEQVEYAARELFGEEVELTHQSVPVGADPPDEAGLPHNAVAATDEGNGVCL